MGFPSLSVGFFWAKLAFLSFASSSIRIAINLGLNYISSHIIPYHPSPPPSVPTIFFLNETSSSWWVLRRNFAEQNLRGLECRSVAMYQDGMDLDQLEDLGRFTQKPSRNFPGNDTSTGNSPGNFMEGCCWNDPPEKWRRGFLDKGRIVFFLSCLKFLGFLKQIQDKKIIEDPNSVPSPLVQRKTQASRKQELHVKCDRTGLAFLNIGVPLLHSVC